MRVKDCCYLHSSKLSRFRICCAHSTSQFHSLYSLNYTVWNKSNLHSIALVLSPRAVFKIKNIHQIHQTCAIIRAVRRGFHSTISHRFQILPNKKNYHGFLPKLYRHIYNRNDGNDLNQRGENFS